MTNKHETGLQSVATFLGEQIDKLNGLKAEDKQYYERFGHDLHKCFRCLDGEHVLIRYPFRWHLDGEVVSNGYEMFDVENILDLIGMKIVEGYGDHIFIVKGLS